MSHVRVRPPRPARPWCPECGYAFDWAALLEARRTGHPFLFEHHPRRNAWSLVRTLAAGLRPRRFWASVTAAHRVVVRRLALYCLLTVGVGALAACGGVFLVQSIALYDRMQDERRFETAAVARNPQVARQWLRGRPLATYLEEQYPLPPSPAFVRRVARQVADDERVRVAVVCAVCWPWVTWLALQAFLWSMVSSKVYPRHVARCVVYAADAFLWAAPLAATGVANAAFDLPAVLRLVVGADATLVIVVAAAWAVAAYRLTAAYATYLRFPHAVAVVAASQVIAVMGVSKVVLVLSGN